ncbi:MAG: alpha/beta hydrolase [Desulfohalobiaceae bacterium]|nr:alpha/beta hydrolase [Desulfohalobiaceae bacterium]MCF8086099.1 alpha/beta hydrolase [Desulfohalobiaceae bacterium]
MQQPESTKRDHAWQNVSFVNSRGERLAGLFYACSEVKTVLVICHGFTGSKEGGGRALEMAEYLALPGLGVLLFDFSGNGESEGSFAETTLSGQMDDLKCAADWCMNAGAKHLVGMGRSFGGTTLLCQAARDSRFEAVCAWATPAHPYNLFQGFVREQSGGMITIAGEGDSLRMRREFLDDLGEHDVEACAARIPPRPLLVVHGERDEMVPPEEAEAIHRAASPSSRLRMIPEADHRFTTGAETVWRICREWLEEL